MAGGVHQYTDAQLYTQLRYYASLFDVQSARRKTTAKKGAHRILVRAVLVVADAFARGSGV